MKGLLIKDFKLVKIQKNLFLLIIAIGTVMAFCMNKVSFLLGYLTSVMPIFAVSTISYDEYDNGNAFLFTLPITRKEYVIEKYCFSGLLGLASTFIAVLLALVFCMLKNLSLTPIIYTPIIFGIMLIFLSVMLPIQLKFGAEKSRIAIVAFGGIAFLIGYGILKLCEILKIDINALLNNILKINIGIIISALVILIALVVLISLKISIIIINKKEF